MGKLSEYKIPFKGLSDELHQFDFKVGDSFFADLDSSELEEGDLDVVLTFDKQPRLFTLTFRINGNVNIPCDRCLGLLAYPVDTEQTLFIRFGSESEDISDNVILIPENEFQFDVSQYIYEFIILALPMKRVHPDDEEGNSTCDPFFLERLGSAESNETSDPRWDALKKLKDEQ